MEGKTMLNEIVSDLKQPTVLPPKSGRLPLSAQTTAASYFK